MAWRASWCYPDGVLLYCPVAKGCSHPDDHRPGRAARVRQPVNDCVTIPAVRPTGGCPA